MSVHSTVSRTLTSIPQAPTLPSMESLGIKPRDPQAKGVYIGSSDLSARAGQLRVINALKQKPLKDRDIRVQNLITRDSMTSVMGKATRYARFKDCMMRAAYKLAYRKSAGDDFGSLHKSVMRLVDKYQDQVKSGATDHEQVGTLRQIKEKLDAMQDKRDGDDYLLDRYDKDRSENSELRLLSKFIDHEMTVHPSGHVERGTKLLEEDYPRLKAMDAPPEKKLELLLEAQDHLRSAIAGGINDEQTLATLESVDREIEKVKASIKEPPEDPVIEITDPGSSPTTTTTGTLTEPDDISAREKHDKFMHSTKQNTLNTEIEQFGKKGKLNHVETRVFDPVADMRAKNKEAREQHDKFLHSTKQSPLNTEIEQFGKKGKLNHVETRVSDPVAEERAKNKEAREKHNELMTEVDKNPERAANLDDLHRELQQFDRSKLTHVDPSMQKGSGA